MKHKRFITSGCSGFTIVEIIVVVSLIGILAAIGLVGYRNVQKNATETKLAADLTNTANLLKLARNDEDGSYPYTLPPDSKRSEGVTITIMTKGNVYPSLTPVQSGVLFQNICQELITQGYGTGKNIVGGDEAYITGCNVYNNNAMQINGWDAHDFSTPITSTSVYNYYNGAITSDAYRPNKKQTFLNFATELQNRYVAQGGAFPVAKFYDPWANSSNGGTMKENLPAPTTGDATKFCVQAVDAKFPENVWSVTDSVKTKQGACI